MRSIFGIIIFLLDAWAIINVVSSRARALHKVLWVLFILLLPILGFLSWLLLGPRSRGRPPLGR